LRRGGGTRALIFSTSSRGESRIAQVPSLQRGLGLNDIDYKQNFDIVQQDRDGSTLRRWSITNAWPVKFVAGEWDNEADENVIESVTLSFDYFELQQK
jgi:phage tail-like protein